MQNDDDDDDDYGLRKLSRDSVTPRSVISRKSFPCRGLLSWMQRLGGAHSRGCSQALPIRKSLSTLRPEMRAKMCAEMRPEMRAKICAEMRPETLVRPDPLAQPDPQTRCEQCVASWATKISAKARPPLPGRLVPPLKSRRQTET